MSSIGALVAPAAAAGGLAQSLALARAANPRSGASTFDQQLDLARLNRAGKSADEHSAAAEISQSAASIEGLRAEHQTALADFELRLRTLLHEHGIEPGEGIVLQSDPHGNVRVAGDHPQKAEIERLFQDDAELRSLFAQLDARASLLRAADQAAELARLQADSPADAAAQVQQLLSTTSPAKFALAVKANQLVAQFH